MRDGLTADYCLLTMSTAANDFEAPLPGDSRSPCPALNALANHGYMYVRNPIWRLHLLTSIQLSSRSGNDLTFSEVINAIHLVYNISYPLAILLTSVGFLTCGKISWPHPSRPSLSATLVLFLMSVLSFFIPSWTLDLSALSARGARKITHNASFVHPDSISSTAPDPRMVERLVDYASKIHHPNGNHHSGLSLVDFGRYHAQREVSAPAKLYSVHEQVALGEGALAWLVLRGSDSPAEHSEAIVPTERIRQWLGEERLPDDWWDSSHGVRPSRTIGLREARRVANLVEKSLATGI